MFCRACASNSSGSLLEATSGALLVAAAAGGVAAIFGGWLVNSIHLGLFFDLVIAFGYGTALGEIILRVTGRKRGMKMEVLAGALPVIGLLTMHFMSLPAEFVIQHGVFGSILNPFSICTAGVAAAGAVNRVRFL